MDTALFHFPLYASCILDFGITETNYHADVMVGGMFSIALISGICSNAPRGNVNITAQGRGKHERSSKYVPAITTSCMGSYVAERCGESKYVAPAKSISGRTVLLSSFHIFIAFFAKPLG